MQWRQGARSRRLCRCQDQRRRNQQVSTQRVQADANGKFSFSTLVLFSARLKPKPKTKTPTVEWAFFCQLALSCWLREQDLNLRWVMSRLLALRICRDDTWSC